MITVVNKKSILKIQFRNFILAVFFSLILIFIIFSEFIPEEGFITTKSLIVAVSSLYFLINIVFFLRNYNYFFFTLDKGNCIFRFYAMRPMSPKQSYVIPIRDFHNFEIRRTLLGIKEELIIFQKTDSGIAKYKPISLSALTKNDRKLLISLLTKIVKVTSNIS